MLQKAALDAQLGTTQSDERGNAVAKVRALMDEYGLRVADLSTRSAPKAKNPTGEVAAKFRDPQSGNAWSGRGLQARWLKAAVEAGRNIEEFAV